MGEVVARGDIGERMRERGREARAMLYTCVRGRHQE